MGYIQKRKGFSPRAQDTTFEKRVILIVTEGTKTEVAYFNWLRQKFRLSSVNVKTIGVGGSPATVVSQSIEEYNDSEIYDMVYCIVDRDKHPRNQFIKARDKLLTEKYKRVFRLIPSYPCFEYWFILHFASDNNPYIQPVDGSGSIGRACKDKLKSQYYPAYEEGSQDILEKLFETKFTDVKRLDAINRAITLFDNININSSINPTTLVFIPAIDIEFMANPNLKEITTRTNKPLIQEVSQERYEKYIKEFFDIFIQQKL